MKTKPLIFVFFVCTLIIISAVAIEPLKGGNQFSETENSQANFGVERVEGGHSGDHDGGNVDGFIRKMINWLEDRGILGGERRREARRKGRGGNEGSWGGETEYSWGRGQNYGHGGVWEGDVHEREENEEPGLG